MSDKCRRFWMLRSKVCRFSKIIHLGCYLGYCAGPRDESFSELGEGWQKLREKTFVISDLMIIDLLFFWLIEKWVRLVTACDSRKSCGDRYILFGLGHRHLDSNEGTACNKSCNSEIFSWLILCDEKSSRLIWKYGFVVSLFERRFRFRWWVSDSFVNFWYSVNIQRTTLRYWPLVAASKNVPWGGISTTIAKSQPTP